MGRVFQISIPGTPHPQGRQRFRGIIQNGKAIPVPAGYPPTSKEYRRVLVEAFQEQWGDAHPMVKTQWFEITWHGCRANSDGDNHLKQLCDALVDAGVLLDDNIRVIPNMVLGWRICPKPSERYIRIKIVEATP